MTQTKQETDDVFRKVEHIGIAVRSLEESDVLYQTLLGVARYKIEEVMTEGVRTAFYQVGETKIELLEAVHPESPIARFIEKRGPGIHHIAFEVTDINASMVRLRDAGFRLINEHPMRGADNKYVCFIHPTSTGGTLIEICQEMTEADRQRAKSGNLT